MLVTLTSLLKFVLKTLKNKTNTYFRNVKLVDNI